MIGYFFKRYNFTLVSFMIGLFLGRQIDNEMYRFVALFGSDYLKVFGRPITVTFMALIVLTITLKIIKYRQQKKQGAK